MVRKPLSVLLALSLLGGAAGCLHKSVGTVKSFDEIDYGVPTQYRHIGRHKLAFVDLGPRDAPALVMLHPWWGTARYWDQIWPHFTDRYRVIAIDLPGHGKSDKPAGSAYRIPMMGRVVRKLLRRVGVERAVFIGNSTGGAVSLESALAAPEMVEGLVLVDSAGMLRAGPITLKGVASATRPDNIATADPRLLALGFRYVTFGFGSAKRGAPYERDLLATYGTDAWREFAVSSSKVLRSVTRFNLERRLSEITQPALVVWGEDDPVIPIDVGRTMAEKLGNARFEMIPDCAHMPELSHPEVLTRLIAGFLERSAGDEARQ